MRPSLSDRTVADAARGGVMREDSSHAPTAAPTRLGSRPSMPHRRPDLHALTGLRFLAALAVVAVHLSGHIEALLPGAFTALRPALSVGKLGVELFFVLSGFILGYHYLDAFTQPSWARYRRFLRQRLARIYPLHIATLAVLALFVGLMSGLGRPVASASSFGVGQLFANVALVHCWTLRDCGLSWNGPAWSLSAEWFAYLLFPLVALVVARTRRRGVILAALGGVVAAQLWASELAVLDGGIGRVGATFVLGVLLARLHLDGLPDLQWRAVALWAFAAAPLLGTGLAAAGRPPTAIIPLFGLLVLGLANAPDGGLARRLGGPRLTFWGQASYGLYMTHAVVLTILAEFVRLETIAAAPLWVRVLVIAAYPAVMCLVAAVAFREVEEPYRALVRNAAPRGGRSRSAPAPVLAPAAQQVAQSAPIS
jgi:peptidoglycan/LPS O-acetylase OafA/YrhL